MKRNQIRVLLVEDNPGDARLVEEMLSEVPMPEIRVTHVLRFEDAIGRLRRERFDVLLLDLMLEDSGRLGTLMEIYDYASGLPIVVLTGLDDQSVGIWVLSQGAQDYLIKGKVDTYTLAHAIQSAIERHRERSDRDGRPRLTATAS